MSRPEKALEHTRALLARSPAVWALLGVAAEVEALPLIHIMDADDQLAARVPVPFIMLTADNDPPERIGHDAQLHRYTVTGEVMIAAADADTVSGSEEFLAAWRIDTADDEILADFEQNRASYWLDLLEVAVLPPVRIPADEEDGGALLGSVMLSWECVA